MVLLKFKEGIDWYTANWVFRQFAAHLIDACPNDEPLQKILTRIQSNAGLRFERLEAKEATATLAAMKTVAANLLIADSHRWTELSPDDLNSQKQYLASLTELLTAMAKAEGKSIEEFMKGAF